MIPSFIILFREALEIAIILSIILAATRGIPGRGRWVMIGIAGGLLGSALVASFAGAISNAVEGMGQEIFNAAVLLVAVLMIGWTVIWMRTHAIEMVHRFKEVGKAVQAGELPLYALAAVVSISMWREGAEIVLFMTGILRTSEESLLAIIAGSTAGAVVAGAIGAALYFGLVKFSTKHLFSVTSWLLILLASGMSAQASGYLIAADLLPSLGEVWDSSALLSENSLVGKILHAMLGYSERPDATQLLAYLATLATILGIQKAKHPAAPKTAAA